MLASKTAILSFHLCNLPQFGLASSVFATKPMLRFCSAPIGCFAGIRNLLAPMNENCCGVAKTTRLIALFDVATPYRRLDDSVKTGLQGIEIFL